MVVEADESDGSFLRLDGTIAVVTNIDPEHLDHYGSFEALKAAFIQFVENVPFYGAAVLCLDHPEVQNVIAAVRDRRVITYGFSTHADLTAENIAPTPAGSRFDALWRTRDGAERRIAGIELPMPGRHNVQNALAAIAVAIEMGCEDETVRAGFRSFGGVRRRFSRVGRIAVGTGYAEVIDDYAHHPVEIRAVLAAARDTIGSTSGRVIAVVQPHRYTRLRDLMSEFQGAFADADLVFAAPVYTAGEEPIAGVDSAALVAGLKARGHRSAAEVSGPAELARRLSEVLEPGDMVVCLGAGDITRWAAALAGEVSRTREEAA
jgi:UDP-N-acetylmuramate--alanine ligase